VGFEFFFRDQGDYEPKKVRVEQVNENGQTLKVMDLGTKSLIEKNIFPGELTVGIATRSENDPVIMLLRQLKINPLPFINPNLRERPSEAEEFRTPPSIFGNVLPLRRSAPPVIFQADAGNFRPERPELRGFRAVTPSPIRQMSVPVRGEHAQRGGAAFRPFRPIFRATRPSPAIPVREPERREATRPERPDGQFRFFDRRFPEGYAEERRMGQMGRRERAHGDPREAEMLGKRAAWEEGEIPEGPAGFPGRRIYGHQEWGPAQNPEFAEAGRDDRWSRYQNEGDRDREEEEVLGPREERRRKEEREEREGRADRERGQRMHGDPGRLYWWRDEQGFGDKLRGRDFWPRAEKEQRHERAYGEAQGVGAEEGGFTRKEAVIGGRRRRETGEELETRIAALERDRTYDRTRAGLNTELRRLQSGVSPFDHPGLFSHIDQMVTLHEAPMTHRGPMALAGATSDIIKVPHIKLSYLGDAIWEFTWRKCAKGGEHLTDQQVLEIEARVMEYFGKQRIEAGKILDKAGITPGRGGR
jgi:hypothetical protein